MAWFHPGALGRPHTTRAVTFAAPPEPYAVRSWVVGGPLLGIGTQTCPAPSFAILPPPRPALERDRPARTTPPPTAATATGSARTPHPVEPACSRFACGRASVIGRHRGRNGERMSATTTTSGSDERKTHWPTKRSHVRPNHHGSFRNTGPGEP